MKKFHKNVCNLSNPGVFVNIVLLSFFHAKCNGTMDQSTQVETSVLPSFYFGQSIAVKLSDGFIANRCVRTILHSINLWLKE